ncbi:hypothetical protein C1645_839655 [Glomus cerebriforme]|uniref:Uncharacterized protein n=1 Tax=Glomus cerebriforme TaxID=658196 RepID=A0A397S1S1_9GLOM|nr:hypothetical protein C1645_839655 [Glomus cerebriforme]
MASLAESVKIKSFSAFPKRKKIGINLVRIMQQIGVHSLCIDIDIEVDIEVDIDININIDIDIELSIFNFKWIKVVYIEFC